MQEKIIVIGIGLIFIGILLLVIGSFIGIGKGTTKIEGGFGGFIGPVPFGFFSSWNAFWIWAVIFIILVVLWFLIKNSIF